MEISGTTRLIPILGHPVAQVKTPAAINAWCAQAGADAVMIPIDIPPDRIAPFFDVVRASETIIGLSITYPHKQAALAAVDAATARCHRIGAVNTIRRDPDGRLIGDMTDGLAMRSALERAGCAVAGKSVLLAGGGGGAGAAIADALCEAGVGQVLLAEQDSARRARILAVLRDRFSDVAISEDDGSADIDIGINASPLGMAPGDPLPFDPGRISRGGAVADAVTPDTPARLGLAAEAMDFISVTGAMMADAQLPFQLAHWGLRRGEAKGQPR